MIHSTQSASHPSIAVIGMAARLPGAKDLETFWRNLCQGVESISFFDDQELKAADVDPDVLGAPNYVKAHGALDGIELFDASFFGFRGQEARIMDPQQRLFLECAWESLENAGYDSERYDGAIGVFAGIGVDSYALSNLISNRELLMALGALQTSIGNRPDHLTTQTCYRLNLRGPGITIQTACSTSLVAVHVACQNLLNGECDMALAGGVSLSVPQRTGYMFQEGGILSPDGHCRAFDARARGTVAGSGVGIVTLKRLEESLRDGDTIQAVIRGSAINNDGSFKVGYTAPSVDGQAAAIAEAIAVADVDSDTITYVEAHGTGTALGDPIEIEALSRAFGNRSKRKRSCAIGSVKSNVGHLDSAAGITGLLKTVLALKNKQIPPSLHYETPNPEIDFASSGFHVINKLSPWESNGAPRRAGVSSFGLGGTNAHVVLEEAPEAAVDDECRPWHLLLLSAKSSTALEHATTRLADHLKQHPDLSLADVAYTLQVGRRAFAHQRVIVCQDGNAAETLESLDPRRVLTGVKKPQRRPVVFMFSGQGSQYVDMARELYRVEPTFREHVDRCCQQLEPHLELHLLDVMFPRADRFADAAARLAQTAITQPALFVIEYSMAQLWSQWGVRPEAMVGHSIGELVAACLSGVISLADALALVAARGKLMQRLPAGAMLAVRLSQEQLEPWLGEQVSLAAVNAPEQCVVSGTVEEINSLQQQMAEQDIGCRRLQTSHAFHSYMMEPIVDTFLRTVEKIKLSPPRIPYLSNVTGTWITDEEATDPSYWARHLRQTVQFNRALGHLVKEQDWILLEVGPGWTLKTIARWHPDRAAGQVALSSIPAPPSGEDQRRDSDVAFTLTTLGQLWLAGVQIDWPAFHKHWKRQRVPLPSYPFQRQRYWVEPSGGADGAQGIAGQKKPHSSDWFYVPSWKRTAPRVHSAGHTDDSRWLVFVDGLGLGHQIAEQLEKTGPAVVTVAEGDSFTKMGDRAYQINPGSSDHYGQLIRELRARDLVPNTIVHLWSVGPSSPSGSPATERQLDLGFYSLLWLVQALGAEIGTKNIGLGVVTDQMQQVTGAELSYPEKATVIGPCRAMGKEYPNLRCSSIDVEISRSEPDAIGQLSRQLIAELSADQTDDVVAYRGPYRWVQTFEPIALHGQDHQPARLRQHGVYLITGGLGGIGLELADYLARTVQAKLVLTARSPFPPRDQWEKHVAVSPHEQAISSKLGKLLQIEQHGGDVLILRADVANEKEMRAAIDHATERFGPVQGVIHAAGVPGGGMMQLKTRQAAASVLAPKVQGTRVLEALLRDNQLDFFVLCSSRSSILGGFGQVDYCAANAYLDAFAHYHASRRGVPTVSVNWPGWQEVGMRVDTLARLGFTKPSKPAAPSSEPYHPLLEERIDQTPQQEVYATQFNVDKHWVLDDHRIIRKAVIPGVAYLEMARAAVERHAGGRAIELGDVFFLAACSVRDDETREVRTVLKRTSEGFEFHVYSKSAAQGENESDWQEFAFGNAGLIDTQDEIRHDLKGLIDRCNHRVVVAADEPLTHDDLGPRWQCLKKAYIGHNELLAELELSEAFAADLSTFKLHPALLDRTNGAAKIYLAGAGFYMPMSYKSLKIRRPLPRRLYAYHRFTPDADVNRETINFDVLLMDEGGVELVEIERFSQKRVNVVAEPIKKALAAAKDSARPQSHASDSRPREQAEDRQAKPADPTDEAILAEGLSPREGVEAFCRVLSTESIPQIVVSPNDLKAAIERSKAAKPLSITQSDAEPSPRQPSHPRPEIQSAYAAPRTDVERQLVDIWQDTLGIDQVGVHDNFFDLGGDSVVGIQMLAKIGRAGFQLTPQELFQHQTIAELAAVMDGSSASATSEPRQSLREFHTGPVPLTAEQQWFIENSPGAERQNHAVWVPLPHGLGGAQLPQALEQLTTRHDALRLRIEKTNRGWQQSAAPLNEMPPLQTVDLTAVASDAAEFAMRSVASGLRARVCLSGGPLVRCVHFELGPGDSSRLLVVVHDAIVDEASLQILSEELQSVIGQLASAEDVQLPPSSASFSQWARRSASRTERSMLSDGLDYWLAVSRRHAASLPVDDWPEAATAKAATRSLTVSLDARQTQDLRQTTDSSDVLDITDLLLTALVQVLSQWSGEGSWIVDLQSSWREDRFDDIDLTKTIGRLVSVYPVLLTGSEREDAAGQLKAIKEQLRRVPQRGRGYSRLLFGHDDPETVRELRGIPTADVAFTFLGETVPRPQAGRHWSAAYHLLDVGAFFTDGQLHLTCQYLQDVHRRETVRRVAHDLLGAVQSLVSACRANPLVGYTPADFPLANIDQQQLDRITSVFGRSPDVT